MKLLCALTFIVLIALISAENYLKPHHLVSGTFVPSDRLLAKETVYKERKKKEIHYGEYLYEQKNTTNPYTITCVRVLDHYSNDEGGRAKVSDGGPGSNFVKLDFMTTISQGYTFTIEIYGR